MCIVLISFCLHSLFSLTNQLSLLVCFVYIFLHCDNDHQASPHLLPPHNYIIILSMFAYFSIFLALSLILLLVFFSTFSLYPSIAVLIHYLQFKHDLFLSLLFLLSFLSLLSLLFLHPLYIFVLSNLSLSNSLAQLILFLFYFSFSKCLTFIIAYTRVYTHSLSFLTLPSFLALFFSERVSLFPSSCPYILIA